MAIIRGDTETPESLTLSDVKGKKFRPERRHDINPTFDSNGLNTAYEARESWLER